jgi:hypothetical protein
MLNPLASSQAVLTDDERELGVVVVDIGAGTTDVAIFTGGAIRHTAVIPIAGDLITSDIAMALRTPTKDAEDIKVESGYAKQLLADPEAQVEVPGLGDRSPRMLSKQALAGVIEPRVEEIFSLVQQVVRESGYEEVLSSGIVLTGGSCDARHDRTGRRHLPQARAPWHSQVFQRTGRHGGPAPCCHRDGPARRGPPGPAARLQGGAKERLCEDRVWPFQRLHRGEFLTMHFPTTLARESPHLRHRERWRCTGPPGSPPPRS